MSISIAFILVGGIGFFSFVLICLKASASYGKCPVCRALVPANQLVYSDKVTGRMCKKCLNKMV